MYRADVLPAKVLNARRARSNRHVARRFGLEPDFNEIVVVDDDGEDGGATLFYRMLADSFAGHGFDWIIFDPFEDGSRNYEALYIGKAPIILRVA